jgi:hypothetical protein
MFVVGYLMTLPVSRLYNVDGRMFNEYGTVSGMRISGGSGSPRKEPSPVLPCPHHIPHYLNWDKNSSCLHWKLATNRLNHVTNFVVKLDSKLCDFVVNKYNLKYLCLLRQIRFKITAFSFGKNTT